MPASRVYIKSAAYPLILGFICLATFVAHLETVDPGLMEARNFVTAREMVELGNWLIPSMDGQVRVAKPPLPTWLTALSRIAAGNPDSMFAMRIPAALSAILMILSFFGLCLELNDRNYAVAFLSAGILATNVLVIQMARTNSWDIFSQSFMVAALLFFVRGVTRKQSAGVHFLAFGVAMGLSVLSKGPAAFYAPLFPFGAAYLWTYGFQRVWRTRGLIAGAIVVCALIGLLWPLPVYLKYPEIARTVYESEVRARMTLHGNPWYYYLNFPYIAGVWIVLFAAAFALPYMRRRLADLSVYRLGFIWLIGTVVLLSVLPEKKERYLIPVSFPMSLVIGQVAYALIEKFRHGKATRTDRVILLLHSCLSALLAAAVPLLLFYLRYAGKGTVTAFELILLVAVSITFLFALVLFYSHGKVYSTLLSSILLVALICLFVLPYSRILLYTNPEYGRIRKDVDLVHVKGMPLYRTDDIGMEIVWDVGMSPGRFSESEDRLISEGKSFALLSESHPQDVLSEKQKRRVNLEVLKIFDYGEKRSKKKVYLSLVTPVPLDP